MSVQSQIDSKIYKLKVKDLGEKRPVIYKPKDNHKLMYNNVKMSLMKYVKGKFQAMGVKRRIRKQPSNLNKQLVMRQQTDQNSKQR